MAELPGARFKVGLGGSGEKYQLALKGEDPVALAQAAAAVEKDLRNIPGLGNIQSSASLTRAEIAIRPDFAKAADLGVTSSAIAETLRIATVGDYESALPKLNLSQRQVPIVVKLDTDARQDLEVLGRLMVPGVKGPVMLSQVATFEMSGGPAVISRLNRVRNVNFEVELSGVPLGEVTDAVAKLPSIVNLPAGVQQLEVGDAEVQAEMVAGFGMAMLTGVLCIYIVLVLLFKDFMHPISILPSVILSFGGAFIGLLVTRQDAVHAVLHRPGDADWRVHQKLDFAGGVRHHGAPRIWHDPLRSADRRLPQACPPHHHDHHRHGGRHAAAGDWPG